MFPFLFVSCNIKTDCVAFEKHYRNEELCSMIVEIPPRAGSVYFKAIGRNIKDGKPCECEEESRWWATFSNEIEKGDTIIKRKGELIFYIHKKDTVLTFNWECEGKVYR
jgi:hypothetical protein